MIYFISWYIAISILGLLSFPLTYHLFPALADRGYSLSRVLGLLLWGFLYWLLVSFGLIRNEVGGLLFALSAVVGLSAWAAIKKGETDSCVAWLKRETRQVITVELIFLAAFAAWAFVRANNPELTSAGGEKWMEVAFINAILKSPTFPPHDPWLSGYAISYYYFGYVLTAMLAMITATPGSIAHNLMLSLIFALSAVSAYGLLFNLLAVYWRKDQAAARVGAFFAPLMLLLMSNIEGFLEVLHSYGVGWAGESNFWTWLNLKDLTVAPAVPLGWAPRYWFWWRASRVIQDVDLRGAVLEIIDEFPFFSYLLGDLHPHVLAMPFGLLAGAIALNLYLGGWRGETDLLYFKLGIKKQGLALMAVTLGGLAFLNTWDFPIYLAVVSGAYILSLVGERGWGWGLAEELLKLAVPTALFSVILYLPFYVSFSSQAGGILPNIIFPTRGVHLWVMFAVLFIPLFFFLGWLVKKWPANWKAGFLLAAAVTLLLWAVSAGIGLLASNSEVGKSLIASQGFTSTGEILLAALKRRLEYGGGLLTLLALIGSGLAYLTGAWHQKSEREESSAGPLPFVLMLVVFGGLMVLAPEFVYLRDQFGWRMNTVFKFYYQAWTLWSLAAAFGMAVLFREIGRGPAGTAKKLNPGLLLFAFSMLVVGVMGLTYPAVALPNKTDGFNMATPERRTLDGAAYLGSYNRDDYDAVNWLAAQEPGVVAEAVGGGYSEFARVSAYSGMPTVLGWINHESQWRGGYTEMGSRADDVARLYTTPDWTDALNILRQYNVRYVYVGGLERSTYQVDARKFDQNLTQVYKNGQVVIYSLP